MRRVIYRAGMIPFYVDPDTNECKMLFMVPSDTRYGGDSPQFAKGRVESDENHEEAAIREAAEELGLKEDNILWFTYLDQVLGYTHMYICEVESMEDFNEPHYETEYTTWLTLSEFEEIGRDIHRPVIRDAMLVFEDIKRGEEDGIFDDEFEDGDD